ncbi:MAG TPA: pitrilysin family protein, partial [Actinopolymorphaceae bacterium]
ESVQSLSRRQIRGWFGRRYQLPSMVVSAAGNVEHDKLVRLVRKAFAPRLVDAPKAPPAPPRRQSTGRNRWEPGIDGARIRLVNRHTEQAHVVLGMSSLTRDDPDRMALSVVNTALGGGMSSRLFNDIREKRGLAYSVFSCTSAFADAGTFAVYAGCLPAKTREVLDRMSAAVREIAADGITGDELIRAKGALRGSLVLGLEDPSSRMTRLGKSELVYPEFRSTDDLLAMIDAVTLDHANAVAARVLSDEQRIAVVGPFRSARKLIGP